MSGSSSGTGAGGSGGTNPAEAEFQRYKARMAGASPTMVPVMMGAGWAVPPSLAAFGAASQPGFGASAGSIGERLGLTLRLGIDFLNGLLASGAGTLGSAAAMLPRSECGCGGNCDCSGNCGCGGDCGYYCCAVMGCDCCRPGLLGRCR